MADVFISYARKDQGFVRALHKALEKRNRKPWVDWEDIPLTAKWLEEVYAGIESSDSFAFVISPDSIESEYCIVELNHAAQNNKRLVPLLHRDVDDKAVPPDLASHQYVFFRESDDFERSFESLIDALDTDLEWLQTHTRLLVRAKEWDREGRDRSLLLRGKDLEAAEEWLGQETAEKEPKPTDLHKQYIIASREAEDAARAAARRQRLLLGAAIAVAVVIAILGVFALTQRNEAINQTEEANNQKNIALAHLLVARAELLSNQGGALLPSSVLLAAEAKRRLPSSVEADQVLHSGLDLLHSPDANLTHEDAVNGIAFGPDGKYLATASDDKTARLWDATSGSEAAPPMTHDGPVNGVAFSPNGKYLATASADKTASLWDTANGSEVAGMDHDDAVNGVAFSPDGRYLATASKDSTARVWDAVGGREIARMSHEDSVNSVAFSPDGRYLATASRDGTARVWDTASGGKVTPPMTHEDIANDVAFSPDGRYLATASRDKTARVWDADSGSEEERIPREDRVNSIAFSPDGKYLATASDDKTARVQRWRSEGLIEEVCARVNRDLTQEEWQLYLGDDEEYRGTCSELSGLEE